MLAERLGRVHEDHALLLDGLLDVRIRGFGVELGLDAGEELALLLGDAEAFEGLLDVVGHVLPGALRLLALREVVPDFLEIDVLEILRRPVRGQRHGLEGLQRLMAELADPLRLLLGGADVVDGRGVEAGAGVEVVLHVVGEVADGLVDARDGIGGILGREGDGFGIGDGAHGGRWERS